MRFELFYGLYILLCFIRAQSGIFLGGRDWKLVNLQSLNSYLFLECHSMTVFGIDESLWRNHIMLPDSGGFLSFKLASN